MNNMSPTAQNSSTNNKENIEILKRLGIEFYTDNNGAIQSRRSKVISVEKLFTDPELLKRFKGGWFISDPSGTQWFYIKINNGRIIDFIPITSVAILRVLLINYCGGKFDFLYLEYSTNITHTDLQSTVVHYNNYSPKRINNEFKGLPYISDEGEKLKGSLLYYLISQHLKNPTPQNILHIVSKQGWWITPLKKYKFNPSTNYRKEILEQLTPAVQCRENSIQSTDPSQDITKDLQLLFEDKPPFQVSILFRMGSLFSTFFTHYGVISDQILVVHPNENVPTELNCALFKNVRYDNLNCPPLGPNIKPLKRDIKNINDGVVLSIDSFAADQYPKIEKGIDCYINDINGATEEDISVNHIPVIISSFADLHIPQNMRCVLEFDDFKTKYDAIQYRNLLRKLDALLIYNAENNFEIFIKTFVQHLTDVKNRIPSNMPKSKVNTFIRLLTMIRTYNALFSPFFPVSLEQQIEEWLCFQGQNTQTLDDIICSEFGEVLNQRISAGYFNFVLKEEVTPFDKGSHTMIIDQDERRVYIETEESFDIVKNNMRSINDTDKLTTALANENYLHVNVHNSKCHKLATIDSDNKPHQLYSYGIKYQLITPVNKQRFSLIGKDIYLFERDEIPTENFLPLGKTVDGRYFGKMIIYEEEESNVYFGTGRTGSGKSWAIAQILPMMLMLGHNIIVFDVSGSYTKDKILKRKILPVEVVEHLFKFINVGEKSNKIPVDLLSFKDCLSKQEALMNLQSIIRSCAGKLNEKQKKKLTSFVYDYIDFTETKDINIFDLCEWLKGCGAVCKHIAETVLHILHSINDIGFEEQTWEKLFTENNKVIVLNLGNEVDNSTHQLLDIMVSSVFRWQMTHDSKFLSVAVDELMDQNLSKNSPLNTIITEGRKFHTALIGATQDYFNQGSSYLDTMKQANIKSFCRPGKSEDRVAQKLGYSNASAAGFYKFKAGDVIIEGDFYNKELQMNTSTILKGRVVDFIETPLYEKFKKQYLHPDVPLNYYGNTR